MSRKLLAIAIASILPAVASASPINFYGEANVSTDIVSSDKQGSMYDSVDADRTRGLIESNSSRIGLKGEQNLGNGLNAKYVAEWGYEVDQAGNNDLTGRDRYVALESEYGAVRWGAYNTPIKNAQNKVDRFNDLKIADMASGFAKVTREDRYDNAVGYTSPKIGGAIVADVVYSTTEDTTTDVAYDKGSASIAYDVDGFYVGVGYERQQAGGNAENAYRVAVNAEVVPNLEVGVMYQSDKIAGYTAKNGSYKAQQAVLVSGQYALDKSNTLKAQMINVTADDSGDDARSFTLGYENTPVKAKNVTIYGLVSYGEKGDANSTGVSAGVKYKF